MHREPRHLSALYSSHAANYARVRTEQRFLTLTVGPTTAAVVQQRYNSAIRTGRGQLLLRL